MCGPITSWQLVNEILFSSSADNNVLKKQDNRLLSASSKPALFCIIFIP